ncbi:MAG: flagellar motor switch protein FliN [Candidatus Eremiobacteraeota bacterium]|nr:flagellar motor switch protein FliN [Candidatus Eremiobacteraeota bacterium]MBV8499110.1 flagellar motor switch protein FliN [Candidatus Eremiobacteraeota bacterium]
MDAKKPPDAATVGVLMHIPLRLTVELGSCTMSVAEILRLGAGSIVELDRAANHPVNLLVNNRPIARGEIVAIEENFGLRITELLAL